MRSEIWILGYVSQSIYLQKASIWAFSFYESIHIKITHLRAKLQKTKRGEKEKGEKEKGDTKMEIAQKNVKLFIGGMTCMKCPGKIEKELKHTEGILDANVSYSDSTADIVYDENKISLDQMIDVIEKLDYKVLSDKGEEKPDIVKIICMLVIILSLYMILQTMGILNLLVPSQLADTKMGYGMLFVTGLVTSVHCIAMCGGINLSQCLPQTAQRREEKGSKFTTFLPALSYNLGRVLSYTMVGFVLGLMGFLAGGGTEVGLPILLQGVVKMAAGFLMVVMGMNMLNLFPWLRRFAIRMPKWLIKKIGRRKAKSSRPFGVGILNGFMPCGPLQSMWMVALVSGNPFAGALSMFLFSLGTVPLMMGLGSMVSVLGKRFTDKVMTVGAILVITLGLAMMSQGGSLSGWLPSDLLLVLLIMFCIVGVLFSIPVKKKVWKNVVRAVCLLLVISLCALWGHLTIMNRSNGETATEAEVMDGVQVINSTLLPGRYPDITVQAGVPVRWVIDAPEGSINGCNYKILIREYDMEYTFHTGENVIEFTPEKPGTVRYSCWMGMIRGSIFVIDENQGDE